MFRRNEELINRLENTVKEQATLLGEKEAQLSAVQRAAAFAKGSAESLQQLVNFMQKELDFARERIKLLEGVVWTPGSSVGRETKSSDPFEEDEHEVEKLQDAYVVDEDGLI